MFRTIYLSKASYTFSHDELAIMCRDFAARNIKRKVTGVLLRIGNYFVQILEGDTEVVSDLMGKIRQDSRHGAVTTLFEQHDVPRVFAGWSMNFIDCETNYYFNLMKLPELREQITSIVSASDDQKAVFSSLILELVDCIRSSTAREPIAAV